MTRFKVIVPAWNGARYIARCIRSLKAQTFRNWEALIWDDASTDGTLSAAQKAIGRDKRFKLIHSKEQRGQAHSRWKGIHFLKPKPTDVIVELDGDDCLVPHALARIAEEYRNPKVQLTYGSWGFIQANGTLDPGNARPYDERTNEKRNWRGKGWNGIAPRTYRFRLFRQLSLHDFKYPDWSWMKRGTDVATMLSLLELNDGEARFIPDLLYCVEGNNPLSGRYLYDAEFSHWNLERIKHTRRREVFRAPPSPATIHCYRPGGVGDYFMLIAAARAISRKHREHEPTVRVCCEFQDVPQELAPLLDANLEPGFWRFEKAHWQVLYDLPFFAARLVRDPRQGFKQFVPHPELYDNWHRRRGELPGFYGQGVSYLVGSLASLGIMLEPEDLESYLPYQDVPFPGLRRDEYVVVHHGADNRTRKGREEVYQTKNWPVRHWHELVGHLTADGLHCVQLGTLSEDPIDGAADLRGQTTLMEALSVLEGAKLLVDTEGGLVHMARAMRTPAVVLFGPTDPDGFGYDGHSRVLASINCGWQPCCWKEEDGKPLWKDACFLTGDEESFCMSALLPRVVRKAVNRMLRKENGKTMRRKAMTLLIALFLSFLIVGCATQRIPEGTDALQRAQTEGPQSGSAKSGVSSAELPVAPSTLVNSPNADASPTAVNSNYRPQQSNSVSGHLVTAIVASLTTEQIAELRKDVVLTSIADELKWRLENQEDGTEYQERVDKLRADYAARSSQLFAEAKTGTPSFNALTHIINIGIITGNAGATERAPTAEESKNLPRLLTNIVAAARGERAILGPDEKSEADKPEETPEEGTGE